MLPYLNKYSFYPVLFNIFLALFVSGGPLRCRRRGTRGYRGRAPRKAWDVFVGPLCATDKVYFFCSFFIKERDIHLGAPSISLVLQRQEPTRHVSWGPLSSWRCCCCRSFVLQPLHLCLWDRAIPATALRQHATEACSAAVAAVSAAIAAAAAGGPHQEPHPPFPQRGLCRSVLASPSCGATTAARLPAAAVLAPTYAALASPAAAAVPSADAAAAGGKTLPLSFPLGFLGLGRPQPRRSWLLQQQLKKEGPLDKLKDSSFFRCCSSMLRAYGQVPPATRIWLSLSLLLSLLATGDPPLVAPEAFCMHWGRAGRALELWRPLTGALYQGPLSFSTLTRIYAAYVALKQLEGTERQALLQQPCSNPKALSPRRQQLLQQQQQQLLQLQRDLQKHWKDPKAFAAAAAAASGTAHLLQFLAFECLLLAAAGGALGMPFYGGPLTASATYLLSKNSPDRGAPLPLGLQVPHWALPFALAAIDALQQQHIKGAFPALLGIATGHAFYLLKKVSPQQHLQFRV